MPERSNIETPRVDPYAGFVAGAPAVGEFNCSECGYGVIVQRTLPLCPMCGGTAWEQSVWRPFSRFPAAEPLRE